MIIMMTVVMMLIIMSNAESADYAHFNQHHYHRHHDDPADHDNHDDPHHQPSGGCWPLCPGVAAIRIYLTVAAAPYLILGSILMVTIMIMRIRWSHR